MLPNLPLWSPRWRFEDGKLEYLPYPRFPTWLIAWDLTELLEFVIVASDTAVEALEAAEAAQSTADGAAAALAPISEMALDAYELATDAAEIAIDALNDAATAQAAADAAQDDADAALAAAGAATGYPRYHFFLPRMMRPLVVGWGAFAVAATSPLNGASVLSGDGSSATMMLPMLAGDWRINMNVIALSTGCTFEIRFDNVTYQVGENYNATQLNNQEIALDFTIGASALYEMKILINGHPSGSTGYNLWCSFIALYYLD